MNKISLLIILFLCPYLLYAQLTFVSQIQAITSLSKEEIKAVSPHFPIEEKNNTLFTKKLKQWYSNYPNEYHSFTNHEKYINNSFSWFSFGLDVKEEQIDNYLNDDLLRWIDKHSITKEQVNLAAPHFPKIPNTQNKRLNAATFNHLKVKWIENYPNELNNILAIEYGNYNPPKEGPHFQSYEPATQKPIWYLEGEPNVVYKMKLKHWYYMHDQEKYKKLYGTPPPLPEKYSSMEEYIKDNTRNQN